MSRLLTVVLIFSAGFGLISAFNWFTRQAIIGRKKDDLPFTLDGRPVILYFTTPECVPCKTIQEPAISKLVMEYGQDSIQIVRIDAAVKPDLASQWKVLSVPTTFIFDRAGEIKHINRGVSDYHKLKKLVSHFL